MLNMKGMKYLFFLVSAFSMLIAVSCNKDEPLDETSPVLSVTPVELSTVTSIIAFGADLTPTQKNPAFEYYVNNSDVQVRTTCQGEVENIMLNDNFPDYEVWVKPSAKSVWRIIYDHVWNVKVSVGDKLSAGDILGTVGDKNRTELQINKVSADRELSYCPFDFGTRDFIQQHKVYTEVWCIEETVVP
jgi:hypothetical protein